MWKICIFCWLFSIYNIKRYDKIKVSKRADYFRFIDFIILKTERLAKTEDRK